MPKTTKQLAKAKPRSSRAKAKEPIVEIDGIDLAPETPLVNSRNNIPAENQPPANIIWREEKEPPAAPKIGMDTIPVPDAETQRAGFYLDPWEARRLVIAIPGYKFLKPKG